MNEKVEYKLWEIFRHNGETYQCVPDDIDSNCCGKYEISQELYDETPCMCAPDDRSDNIGVHYVRVAKPKEGMLFRASDGKMYKLKQYIPGKRDCVCNLPTDNTTFSCEDLFSQAFDVCDSPGLRWCLVEEKKEEEDKMEEKKRHIEISVVSVEEHTVTFRISQQTHRGEYFTPNGKEFKSSSGYIMSSNGCPEFEASIETLFVRGWSSCDDGSKITVALEHFAEIMKAVTEYNETNGEGYSELKPGDTFHIINEFGDVEERECEGDNDEVFRLKIFGNFFLTAEEAEAALDRVKKALKGVDKNKLLREALEEAVEMYGPWNVPGDAGGWISKARKALEVEK